MIGVTLHKKKKQRFGERNLETVCYEILNSAGNLHNQRDFCNSK